ncbi:MAG TPA: NAD-dependent epimerase/dehydratase family protein [Tepidisphaeraceae bacterium]|jgi:nucleoside-diphosphate-sugar epimerase|nr:NAD-dependent epimerase/dehydratase family protein [Tepidisphaeraceae bacterium]
MSSKPPAPLTDWRSLHGDHFAGSRVLITGGAGFIGSHLAEALSFLGAEIVVLDDLAGGSHENLRGIGRVEFVEGSILDGNAVAACMRDCRYVFHQAALGSVPRSVEQPFRYHEVNATGTLTVLEAARLAGVRRVMFAASSSAYGETPALPKIETMAPDPLSPYAANKAACEAMCRAYSKSYGLDTAPLRYFNIFGPRQSPDNAYAAVIAAFAKSLLAGRHPTIYGDGEQSRDFTFVHNAVHANLLAARLDRNIEGQVINVACGIQISVNELARAMAEGFGRPELTPIYHPERAGDVKHSVADLKRAKDVLGYRPIVDFQTGLRAAMEWYRATLA